jgi:hypothetical protein
MKSSHSIVALIVTLALLVPTSFAVICSSFTTPDSCNGTYTDVGLCEWNSTTSECFATDVPLPPGKVGITAIPSFDGADDPPVMVDPPPLIQDPPTAVPDKPSLDDTTSPPPVTTDPVVAIPQWNKVNLDNSQVVSPITTEVQNLLPIGLDDQSTTIAPLCIYKRDPDVWAIYSTGNVNDQQEGYVLARTSCSVSMAAGEEKEVTSCTYYLMDFDGSSSSGTNGQSSPGFAGTADSGGGSDVTEGMIVPVSMPVPADFNDVVSMSVQPEIDYSLINVSAAEELCIVGPTEEEPVVGGDDILLMEPAIGDGAERSVGDDDDGSIVEEVTSSSDGGVVMVMRTAVVMVMVVGVGMLV